MPMLKNLIESADQALYLTKHKGRNRVEAVEVKPVEDVSKINLDSPITNKLQINAVYNHSHQKRN